MVLVVLRVALLLAAASACPLLREPKLSLKTSFPDNEVWVASVQLKEWQAGVLVTVLLPTEDVFHDSHVTQTAFAEIERNEPPIVTMSPGGGRWGRRHVI